MKTKHYVIKQDITPQILDEITQTIHQGDVVAIPTETVYGLAANAFDEQAIQKIFHAKGRPADNPLIVHISELSQMQKFVASIPSHVKKLMEIFWPGPITFILPLKPNSVPTNLSAGLQTIAVRMPSHPIARQIIQAVNVPLAAPSANSSGKPSPTTGQHVLHDLSGKIASVVDAGRVDVGLESTVLDCTRTPMVIVRPGAITQTMLQEALQDKVLYEKQLMIDQPISPGMKYQHYAPHQPLTIIEGTFEKFKEFINQQNQQHKVGVLTFSDDEWRDDNIMSYIIAKNDEDIVTANQRLYDGLRYFDETDCEVLFIRQFKHSDESMALHNRLSKAANQRYLKLS